MRLFIITAVIFMSGCVSQGQFKTSMEEHRTLTTKNFKEVEKAVNFIWSEVAELKGKHDIKRRALFQLHSKGDSSEKVV